MSTATPSIEPARRPVQAGAVGISLCQSQIDSDDGHSDKDYKDEASHEHAGLFSYADDAVIADLDLSPASLPVFANEDASDHEASYACENALGRLTRKKTTTNGPPRTPPAKTKVDSEHKARDVSRRAEAGDSPHLEHSRQKQALELVEAGERGPEHGCLARVEWM